MRRTVVLSAATLLVGAVLVAVPASPAAAAACKATGASSDFNGDGFEDLASAEPGDGEGRVHVLYGTASGLSATSPDDTLLTSTANTTDQYGMTVAAGDFNGDGCDDLAVADPYQTIHGLVDAGVVSIFFGSTAGLKGSSLRLTYAGSGGTAQSGDYFGYGLAVGDVNDDGRADLIVGTPNEDTIDVYLGTASGISTTPSAYREGHAGVPGSSGSSGFGAHGFGFALTTGDFDGDGADDVAIGVPGETIGSAEGAGAVIILRGSKTGGPLTTSGSQKWSQGTSGIPGSAEAGDGFGSSLATGDFEGSGHTDLVVGTPDESVDGKASAGAVNIIYSHGSAGLSATGAQLFDENTDGMPGPLAEDEWFGQSLTTGDYSVDTDEDLAIGVPGQTVNGVDAGAVDVLYGSPNGLTVQGVNQITEASPGVPGTPENGDRFGLSVGNLWTQDVWGSQLAIGVPLESVGSTDEAGMVVFVPRDGVNGVDGTGSVAFDEGTAGVKGTECAECEFGLSVT